MSALTKILIGKIVGPQGLRGEVRVQTYTAAPSDFAELGIANDELGIRGKFVRVLPNSSVIIAKIDGADDRNAAESLRGAELFVDRAALPAPAADEYYIADLIGMTVGRRRVAAVHNFGAGDILELDDGEMVSFVGARVDLGKREITLKGDL